MKMVLVFLMLFQCHHKNAQFSQFCIIWVLLNIIFKHNLNKLSKFFQKFFVQCQGYENHCKVVKGVRKLFELFWALWQGYQNFLKDHVKLSKLFARCFRGSKAFLTPQKSLPPQYPVLKMTTRLVDKIKSTVTFKTESC